MINRHYFETFPELESERLHLKKLRPQDASGIRYLRSHPKVMTYMDADVHETLDISQSFIAENLERYQQQRGLFWTIFEKATSKFVGDFAFWNIVTDHHRAEIGYTLKPEFWGKGYMSEAMNRLLRFGFENLQLHRVEADINPANESSRKLLLKAGFQKEAYFRENRYFNGKYIDSEIYALLAREFQEG